MGQTRLGEALPLKGVVVEERAVELGNYILEHKATVRAAAKRYGISKSTVHKDVAQRLKNIDPALYRGVKQILDVNKAQRHIRGGMATRMKYQREAEHKA
ncbi:MAG TPA: sporulation transcriptional regulator SpoIIID [Candidatus Caccousia stercoris]|uniref:Sporulation transcriptional regulator SpoIIID n=1 Tax=Candidatus Caccousia stercoris TaxID=2840723 RepID=A0A9D1FQT5_9FIRM|nr:sporulation transcriptional regulator SpoIIID [Candidatus Caccousia stercoris]